MIKRKRIYMGKTLTIQQSLNEKLSLKQLIFIVLRLSIPAILAQISSIVMQYIDSAMSGSLGAEASASIGLVSTSTWLAGGLCTALAAGFSVQTAQLIGAKKHTEAESVLRQSIIAASVFGALLALTGIILSPFLPVWLGGDPSICSDATKYFLIYSAALPFVQIRQLTSNMLQCSGDMKTPSVLNAAMCGMDVIFNYFLIFPSHTFAAAGFTLTIPGADMGVAGAALGTALAEAATALLMLFMTCFRSPMLRLTKNGSWRIQLQCLKTAAKISLPVAMERTAMCGAQIASTGIIAPLGTVSVAANSLAVTAESFCYMPGYGVGSAATALVGQSIGAGNKRLAKRYAWISVLLGAAMMSVTGILMYIFAPAMFAILTPVEDIRTLGVSVLRIEAAAEPFFAVSIVAMGALRGAGDTFVPGLMNLLSMWCIRITASALLTPYLGLKGVWIAMSGELCIRGSAFLIRLLRGKWLDRNVIKNI